MQMYKLADALRPDPLMPILPDVGSRHRRRHSAAIHVAVVGVRALDEIAGGVESHCAALYPALAERMPRIRFTLFVRRNHVRRSAGRLGRLAVISTWHPPSARLETFLHTPIALIIARLRFAPRVVHIHGIGPALFAPLARLLGMRVIVTHHAFDYLRPKWGLLGRMALRIGETTAGRFAHQIICVSATLHRNFVDVHRSAASRTVTIRHGTVPASLSVEAARRVVAAEGLTWGSYLLVVGRIEETKRIEDAIRAHGTAQMQSPMPLIIVGTSVGNDHYEQRLRGLATGDVRFIGLRTHEALSALYAGAAMLIHASEMEGFGLVVLEALSQGTPVTLSDLPVHREFGLPESRYFSVGDVAALAAQIEQTTVRAERWPPAEKIVAAHDRDAMLSAHLAIFQRLIR